MFIPFETEAYKDVLLPLFPETSKRDNWALRIREEGGDDDIFDIKPGDDVGAKLDEFNVSIYKEEKVTLYYSICKQKRIASFLSIAYPLFVIIWKI